MAFLVTVLPVLPDGPLFQQTQYLAVLLGAIAGFLIYNVYPAWVVMGEGGSLVVGLNMAAMTLHIAQGRGSDLLSIIAVPVLLLMIPIVDATLAALSSLTPRTSDSSAGQDRSSHRLVAMGLSERSAVGLLWLLAAASGVIGIIAERNQRISGLLAAMFTIGMALFAVHLARVRVHEQVDSGTLSATVVPLGLGSGYRRRLVEVMLDLMLVSVAYYGGFRFLFDAVGWAENFPYFLRSFPIVLGTQMVVLFAVCAYRGLWRYFSLSDGLLFAKGVFLGCVASQLAVLYLYRFDGYSPAPFIVYGILLLFLLVGSRASFRLTSESVQRQRQSGRRLVIYGAGNTGSIAVRHLLNDHRSAYRIVGFADDDVSKRNIRVHGYRVIGGYDHLVGMIMAGEVDAVAVAHERPDIRGLAWLCAKHGVTLHRLAVDWREISLSEAAAAGAPVSFMPSESRVVRLTDVRRSRADGPSPVVLREVPGRAPAPVQEQDTAVGRTPEAAPIRAGRIWLSGRFRLKVGPAGCGSCRVRPDRSGCHAANLFLAGWSSTGSCSEQCSG